MAALYISPPWFYGYDIAFQLIFAIICFVIAFFALKIYRASDHPPAKLFGFSFLCIALAYTVQSVFNFLILSTLNEKLYSKVKLLSVTSLDSIGIYLHIILFLTGLVILVSLAFKSSRKQIFWLLLITTIISLFISIIISNVFMLYYLFSSVYLAVISWHYVKNYLYCRETKTLLVAIAFIFIFFGSIHFFLSLNHALFYVIGHFLELAAYLLMVINFYLVLKK